LTACAKGKVERPFFYLEQQFIKGTAFKSLAHFLDELAIFERDDLDVRVHETTQQPPLERFALEQPRLTPLPERRFVGSTTETRKVSWDCLVSYKSNRYSVPSTYAGKMVWLLLSHGTHLLVLSSRRELLVEHELRTGHGEIVMLPEHYAPLRRRGTPQEDRLGRCLRAGGLDGVRFRRQQVIAGFVADFYMDGLRDVPGAAVVANYSRSAGRAGAFGRPPRPSPGDQVLP